MKKIVMTIAIAVVSVMAISAKPTGKTASDTTIVVTVTPPMHCSNCENKIKSNIRFQKGVKSIETDLEKQTVTIVADKKKIDTAKLAKAFSKIGYDVKPVK